MKITEVTRRNIAEGIIGSGISWAGRLGDAEFLGRLFDLEQLPSNDRRHPTMEGEIWEHRVHNPDDWPDNWVFTDPRINFLGCEDEIFLRFLTETLHPIVRSDPREVIRLLELYNQHLVADGFSIHQSGSVSGRPIFDGHAILREHMNSRQASDHEGESIQSPTFLTVAEVAAILRLSEADVLELLQDRELQGLNLKGNWRIFSDQLIEFLGAASRKTQHEVMGKALLDPYRWLKSLAEFPQLKADIEHGTHPEGSFGAWLQEAIRRASKGQQDLNNVPAQTPESLARRHIPIPLLHVLSEQLGNWYYSHSKINRAFTRAGAPGLPPEGNCVDKCRDWFIRINGDPAIEPLEFMGRLLAEFMSKGLHAEPNWKTTWETILGALSTHGLAYDPSRGIIRSECGAAVTPTSNPSKSAAPFIEAVDPFKSKRFDVAFSFPGEHRALVLQVAEGLLAHRLPRERVFYDQWHEHVLARPNLDTYLQHVYGEETNLVVVFLCAQYNVKAWCGLESRAIREMIKDRRCDEIMPVRLDDTPIPGFSSIDGYLDAKRHSPFQLASLMIKRLQSLQT